MRPDPSFVTGVVLAGGQGLRMGGVDKGLVAYEGRSLASLAVANLRPCCATVLISANRNLTDYAALADGVVEDLRPDFPGPLAGLEAALTIAQTPWVLVTPCDMPDVRRELFGELLELLCGRPELSAAVAQDGDRVQPLLCALRRECLPELSRYLDGGGRAVFGWLDGVAHGVVRCSVPGGWVNYNAIRNQ